MKNLRFIFIFIFLSGMIFTVFQYLPILEEETPGHRVELAKKAKQNDLEDGDGDASDEDCDDDDFEKDLSYFYSGNYTHLTFSERSDLTHRNTLYKYLLEHKDTPPPKV